MSILSDDKLTLDSDRRALVVVVVAEAVAVAVDTTISTDLTIRSRRLTHPLTLRPKLQATLQIHTLNVSFFLSLKRLPFRCTNSCNRWWVPELCCALVFVLDVPTTAARWTRCPCWRPSSRRPVIAVLQSQPYVHS